MTKHVYAAYYSELFQNQLLALPPKVLERTLKTIELLRDMPGLGKPYYPSFEADEAPFACNYLVVPKTTKCLFFTVSQEPRELRFFLLRDVRQDPRSTFTGIHGAR